MPQSLTSVYVHLVFSTKYREPTIGDEVKDELYAYLGGICRQLDCHPVKIGGYYDHIHILCALSKKIAIMKLLEEVKKSSSKWMKTKGQAYQNFYWQDGYAAFSVNPSQVDTVVRYITNQYQHHSQTSFQDECRGIYQNMAWLTMNAMCGIDQTRGASPHNEFIGRCPMLGYDAPSGHKSIRSMPP